ncbi:YqcC family protein [Salinisphaera sp. RV14]|uniref:YqcC family protein n=1 Tax=unclassified Salinisphaera TaxID=2649847 RepID=UPI003F847C9A
MTSPTETHALSAAADCVLALEQAMRDGQLWHDEVPAPAAMASRTPFCADTLAFTQWLQFIFVPRMRELIEAGGPLPAASGIAVMAEAKLTGASPAERRVIKVLAAFDRLVAREAN